jgi:hypothetical protein
MFRVLACGSNRCDLIVPALRAGSNVAAGLHDEAMPG